MTRHSLVSKLEVISTSAPCPVFVQLTRTGWSGTSTWRKLSIATSAGDEACCRGGCQCMHECHFRGAWKQNENLINKGGRCSRFQLWWRLLIRVQPFSETLELFSVVKFLIVQLQTHCAFKYHLKLPRRDPQSCLILFQITRRHFFRCSSSRTRTHTKKQSLFENYLCFSKFHERIQIET